MLHNFVIVKKIISFLIPYLLIYAFYIQINGEFSPGGGFQAGVIFASSLIAIDLIKQIEFNTNALICCGVLGVLIYAITGVVALFFDGSYLNYSLLAKVIPLDSTVKAQKIGIFFIEVGVGLTVSAIMVLVYSLLRASETRAN